MDHSDDKADPRRGDGRDAGVEADAAETSAGAAERDGAQPGGAVEGWADKHTGAAAGASGAGRASKSSSSSADLSPFGFGATDLAPFFERAQGGARETPRGRLGRIIDFGGNAAFVICVLGFAFAAGTYFFGGGAPGAFKTAAAPEAPSQESLERAEMMRKTQQMADDIGALKANVEALRASVAQGQAAKDQRGLEKSVDALKAKLDAVKTDTGGQLAEISGKVDRLQRDPSMKQIAERLDRIEKQGAPATGSIAPMVKAATQNRNPAVQAKTEAANEPPKKPALITEWVVRGVYDDVAVVENARGSMEVALGDQIPGAGVVKAIQRRGGGWIVVTTRGVVDYDHSVMVP